MDEQGESPNRRLERKAPSPSGQVREQLTRAAPAETRGRPADGAGLSREEIAERTSDENFQEHPELLTRRSIGDTEVHGFEIPQHLQKPGWVYEWKSRTCLGQPVSAADVARERNQGWRPVPAADVAEMLPPGYDKPVFETDGGLWMMRPRRLQVEARNELYDKAERQRQDKLRQATTGGLLPNDDRMPVEAWGPRGRGRDAPLIEGEIGTWRRNDGA